jgi:PAS domain S-box-containing protein
MNLTLSRKAIILVSVPLAIELALVCFLLALLQQAENERESEAHSREISNEINAAMRHLINAGTNTVIYHVSGSRDSLKQYKVSVREFPKVVERLSLMVKGRQEEEDSLLKMVSLYNRANQNLVEGHRRLEVGDRIGSMKPYANLNKSMAELYVIADKIQSRQSEIQEKQKAAQAATREQIKWLVVAGALLNVLAAVGLVLYFNRGTANRFNVLLDNTMRLASGEPLNAPLAGGDEIARLDRVFRKMANSLAAATQKERAVLQNAADVICSIDADGKFAAMNPAVSKVLGFTPDEMIGARLVQFVHPDDVEKTLDAVKQNIHDKGELALENRMLRKDGTIVDMLWSLHWTEAEKSTICVLHDITYRKELERLKRDFVAMVSHDLRTPLTSISGFLTLLRSGKYNELSPAGLESLRSADASVGRLMSMVNDLLDIERVESGLLDLNLGPLTVEGLVESVFAMLEPIAREKRIELVAPTNKDLEFVGDADRLNQVLVNLVSNAIKFSEPESKIVIDAIENATNVRIEVRDTGRGVPEHLKPAIFERFRQVDPSDAAKRKGTGLGLAISKAIVERHGGSIGVEDNSSDSQGGKKGSVFWFTLPKSDEQDVDVAGNINPGPS